MNETRYAVQNIFEMMHIRTLFLPSFSHCSIMYNNCVEDETQSNRSCVCTYSRIPSCERMFLGMY